MPERIGILAGGWGFERAENLAASRSVSNALATAGHRVELVDLAQPQDLLTLPVGPFAEVEFCFMSITEELLAHPLLESMEIPYSGSPAAATVVFHDKWVTHHVLGSSGVRVPRTELVRIGSQPTDWRRTSFPAIVKPRFGGASVGVSIVLDVKSCEGALARLSGIDEWALVQERVAGVEHTAFLMDARVLGCFALGGQDGVWTHEQKRENTIRFTPSSAPEITSSFERVGRVLAQHGVRNLSRVDAIWDNEELTVLDVNTHPYLGSSPGSTVRALCDFADATHYDLLRFMYATEKFGRNG